MDRAETNSQNIAASRKCTYDELIKSKKTSYCLNQDKLIDLQGLSFENDTDKIVLLIKSILDDIDDNMKPNCVEKFTIGKTYVRQRKSMKFNHLNPNTWRLDGVTSRWSSYQEKDYDGLFVLCVVPKTVIPPNPMKLNQDEYTVALEQRLIQVFCFSENDHRLGNLSFDTGCRVKNPVAGLVYVAFKLRDVVSA